MLDEIEAADHVLVICTATYYRRFRGHDEPRKGKGATWEGAIMTQEIYDSCSRTLKFVPVFVSEAVHDHVPEPLRPYTHYDVTDEASYSNLYEFLLGRPSVQPAPLGAVRPSPLEDPRTCNNGPRPRLLAPNLANIVKYAPSQLFGREAEMQLLSSAWESAVQSNADRPRVLAFVAFGGEGKTSLIAKWLAIMAQKDWPGCDQVFAWSFYSQGARESTETSADLFLKVALTEFGDATMANSPRSSVDKARRLAQLVGSRRALLILDGLEPLQYAPTSPLRGEIRDQGVAALLQALAMRNEGLCLVTTRYSIPQLKAFEQTTVRQEDLSRLSTSAGAALLRSLGVKGSDDEVATFVEEVKGHALTLTISGSHLNAAYAGDIRKRDLLKLEEADQQEYAGHAFRAMRAYVRWLESAGSSGTQGVTVMRLLGLFDRPAQRSALVAMLRAPAIGGLTEPLVGLSQTEMDVVFSRLEVAKLIVLNRGRDGTTVAVDAHPILRDYFAAELRGRRPAAWRAAHSRLYFHFIASSKQTPETLEDLEPLFQALRHGVLAGRGQEAFENVFMRGIMRDQQHYVHYVLGAFGSTLAAIAAFFDEPWTHVLPSLPRGNEMSLLQIAGQCLRATGRLGEASVPMAAALEMAGRYAAPGAAAIVAHTLSEVELASGNVDSALEAAQRSITYATRDTNPYVLIAALTTLANTLHQAGRLDDSAERFHEAEALLSVRGGAWTVLWSIGAFGYAELLLSGAERRAWQRVIGANQLTTSDDDPKEDSSYTEDCDAVSERVAKLIEERAAGSQLDSALEQLMRTRAGLYKTFIEQGSPHAWFAPADQAVDALRRAGTLDYLPYGLLTRAWVRAASRSYTGHDSAQEDLDEAYEIARRGPMPLFSADIYLYRARLFGPVHSRGDCAYPWQSASADLRAARALLEHHGYLRRSHELRDAEVAASRWRR